MVDEQSAPDPEAPSRWCVVGNVVVRRLHGEQGEARPGTKVFTGGTRVFFRSAFWGVAGEAVTVLGLARHSRRWVTTSTDARYIENWRAKLVYTPRVLRELHDEPYPGGEAEARTLAARMNRVSLASSWRLVARTPRECLEAAAGTPIVTGAAPGDDARALVLHRGTEARAGLVYRAPPPVVAGARRAAGFTWCALWVAPDSVLPGEPDVGSTLFTLLQNRFPDHDLTALRAGLSAPRPG